MVKKGADRAPTPGDVVYNPPNPDGSRKSCGTCVMFAYQDKECYLFSPEKEITKDMVCGYHVYGKPMASFEKRLSMNPLDDELAGLETVPGGASCDNCVSYVKNDEAAGKGKCRFVLVDGEHAEVEGRGCCAGWAAAGSIKKSRKLSRRIKLYGMDISIETDKGELRNWYDPHSGEEGATKMRYPYGYIRRTEGADNEHIDVYVGPNRDVDKVYVIHQNKAPDFKEYDEDKVMLGFESIKDAKQAYLMHYNNDKFYRDMDVMSVDEFKNKYVKKALGAPIDDHSLIPQFNPYDMNDAQAVESALSNISSMSDKELARYAKEIWGDGYAYKPISADYVRAELRGFLQDQLELLEVSGPAMIGHVPMPTKIPNG